MVALMNTKRSRLFRQFCSVVVSLLFAITSVMPASLSYAQIAQTLPTPGTFIPVTTVFTPVQIKGLTVNPDNPLQFEFIIDQGDESISNDTLKETSTNLVKYFLASLTTPEQEMWVNLSPYEKNRIISNSLGQTEMGRDLLAQDYILKQLTSSLMHPKEDLGEAFWEKVHSQAYERFGTTTIPIDTFNKVWIVPDQATVYEHNQSAFVVESHLKVMMEQDYVATQHNRSPEQARLPVSPEARRGGPARQAKRVEGEEITNKMIREIIIPAIEEEVNTGKNFANLRQIYNAMILASWYKDNLKDSLLGQIYVNKAKTKGLNPTDPAINQKIYQQYLEAFQKGTHDLIKEDYNPNTKEIIPRKYFSGGAEMNVTRVRQDINRFDDLDAAQLAALPKGNEFIATFNLLEDVTKEDVDRAMVSQVASILDEGATPVEIIEAFGLRLVRNQEDHIVKVAEDDGIIISDEGEVSTDEALELIDEGYLVFGADGVAVLIKEGDLALTASVVENVISDLKTGTPVKEVVERYGLERYRGTLISLHALIYDRFNGTVIVDAEGQEMEIADAIVQADKRYDVFRLEKDIVIIALSNTAEVANQIQDDIKSGKSPATIALDYNLQAYPGTINEGISSVIGNQGVVLDSNGRVLSDSQARSLAGETHVLFVDRQRKIAFVTERKGDAAILGGVQQRKRISQWDREGLSSKSLRRARRPVGVKQPQTRMEQIRESRRRVPQWERNEISADSIKRPRRTPSWDRAMTTISETIPENEASVNIKFGTNGWRTFLRTEDKPDGEFTVHNVGRTAKAIAEDIIEQIESGEMALKDQELGQPKVLVAYDARLGGEEFAKRAVETFAAYGFKADISNSYATTPSVIALSREELGKEGYDVVIHITASHNDVRYQGIKVGRNGVVIPDSHAGRIAGRVNDSQKKTSYERVPFDRLDVEEINLEEAFHVRLKTLFPSIVEDVREYIQAHPERQLVVDVMHGSAAPFVTHLQEAGLEVIRTTPMSEGAYPQGDVLVSGKAMPYRPEPHKDLVDQDAFRQFSENAAEGSVYFAIDGDGDRMAVWVKKGGSVVELQPNDLGILFGWFDVTNGLTKDPRYVLKTQPTTYGMDALAQFAKLELVVTPVGSKHFGPYLSEALLGVEESGHQAVVGVFDDAAVQATLLLQIMTSRNEDPVQSIEAAKEQIRFQGISKRVNVDLTDEIKKQITDPLRENPQALVDQIQASVGKEVVSVTVTDATEADLRIVPLKQLIDENLLMDINNGINVRFEDNSWVQIRLSGTEPVARVYTEAKTEDDRQVLHNAVVRALGVDAAMTSEVFDEEAAFDAAMTLEVDLRPDTVMNVYEDGASGAKQMTAIELLERVRKKGFVGINRIEAFNGDKFVQIRFIDFINDQHTLDGYVKTADAAMFARADLMPETPMQVYFELNDSAPRIMTALDLLRTVRQGGFLGIKQIKGSADGGETFVEMRFLDFIQEANSFDAAMSSQQRNFIEGLGLPSFDEAYLRGLYAKYLASRDPAVPSPEPLVIGDNFTPSALMSPQELRDILGAVNYSEDIVGNGQYLEAAQNVVLVANPMNGGLGSSLKRERYLQTVTGRSEIGAKGTDLFFDVEVSGYDFDGNEITVKERVSIAELKYLQALHLAWEFAEIVVEELVNEDSIGPMNTFLDETIYLFDRVDARVDAPKRTYRQVIEATQKIRLSDRMIKQGALPVIDVASSKLTTDFTAPGGHGQLGSMALQEARTMPLPQGRTLIRTVYNGDGTNNSPDARIIGWMAANRIPLVMISTTKTALDKKGGLIGAKDNGTSKAHAQLLERAQAETVNQLDVFTEMGLSVGEAGGQFFNTNVAAINVSVLRPFLNELLAIIGQEQFDRIVTPDLIENEKEKEGGRKVIQLEGAMGSALLNLNAFVMTADDVRVKALMAEYGFERLLYVVNVNEYDRTGFFTPTKFAWDHWLYAHTDHFEVNLNTGELINAVPGHLPAFGDMDPRYTEMQNVIDALGKDAHVQELTELSLIGDVQLRNAVLKGVVRVENKSGKSVDLYDHRGAFPQTEDGRIIIENSVVTIVENGDFEIKVLSPDAAMLTRVEIRRQVIEIIVDETGFEESKIQSDSNIRLDFGLDSLDMIELIITFEKQFSIDINDVEATDLITVEDFVRFIAQKRGIGSASSDDAMFSDEAMLADVREKAREIYQHIGGTDDFQQDPVDVTSFDLSEEEIEVINQDSGAPIFITVEDDRVLAEVVSTEHLRNIAAQTGEAIRYRFTNILEHLKVIMDTEDKTTAQVALRDLSDDLSIIEEDELIIHEIVRLAAIESDGSFKDLENTSLLDKEISLIRRSVAQAIIKTGNLRARRMEVRVMEAELWRPYWQEAQDYAEIMREKVEALLLFFRELGAIEIDDITRVMVDADGNSAEVIHPDALLKVLEGIAAPDAAMLATPEERAKEIEAIDALLAMLNQRKLVIVKSFFTSTAGSAPGAVAREQKEPNATSPWSRETVYTDVREQKKPSAVAIWLREMQPDVEVRFAELMESSNRPDPAFESNNEVFNRAFRIIRQLADENEFEIGYSFSQDPEEGVLVDPNRTLESININFRLQKLETVDQVVAKFQYGLLELKNILKAADAARLASDERPLAGEASAPNSEEFGDRAMMVGGQLDFGSDIIAIRKAITELFEAEGRNEELTTLISDLGIVKWRDFLTNRIHNIPFTAEAILEAGRAVADSAISTEKENVGGIDLNRSMLNLKIKRDSNGVPIKMNPTEIMKINVEGFYPVLINIAPINVQALPMLLGSGEAPVDSEGSVPFSLSKVDAKIRKTWLAKI